ncbi:NADH-quinone oxidoreductase subunit J family protein [Cerasicoccus arenae]|uniref:NADH-quinone oxidoreductase subunit J n=1 Tax=Cerasicoccus arenae TaxID=424488 RepID=A0A8J3DET5_9BACT|nr:NADH-quinone oxidoreductase subunit J [Cerasicoccus arenae]MBK1856631.1 NADH-quinone oxidoreductase subunit J [Cerasicoccus arenae]GHC12343.1 NADH-quinone oxidoreductase subunit J [Cerasicoccus arenae]
MPDFLFYLFSALTVLSAFLVTVSRNAVNGAMYMIVSFVGMAALFVLLEAYFLAALQVLVYAGAVMVLFLFIIMLLDAGKGRTVRPDRLTTAAACIGGLLLISGLIYITFDSGAAPSTPLPVITELPENATATNIPFTTSSRSFGYGLFTKYMLPFQVTGFLLLIAMIGVIVLSKRIDSSGDEPAKPRIAKS